MQVQSRSGGRVAFSAVGPNSVEVQAQPRGLLLQERAGAGRAGLVHLEVDDHVAVEADVLGVLPADLEDGLDLGREGPRPLRLGGDLVLDQVGADVVAGQIAAGAGGGGEDLADREARRPAPAAESGQRCRAPRRADRRPCGGSSSRARATCPRPPSPAPPWCSPSRCPRPARPPGCGGAGRRCVPRPAGSMLRVGPMPQRVRRPGTPGASASCALQQRPAPSRQVTSRVGSQRRADRAQRPVVLRDEDAPCSRSSSSPGTSAPRGSARRRR